MDKFDVAIKFTLEHEGGYVNDAADPGGATSMGITQRIYSAWCNSNGNRPKDVSLMTREEAKRIYRSWYWNPAKCETMQVPLAIAMFDTAVNFGVKGAIRMLQRCLGLRDDGSYGPLTAAGVARADQVRLAALLVEARQDFRHERVAHRPSQSRFLAGWLARDRALMELVKRV